MTHRREAITIEPTDVKRIRKYSVQLHQKNFDSLDEMEKY